MERLSRRTHHLLELSLLLLLGSAVLSTAAYGQATASIVGTVTDPSGAAVANAKIAITNIETGLVRSTTTNNTGSYAAHELSIGNYRIRAEAPGFKAYEQTGITLNVNDTIRADLSLQVGQVQESVTVEANALQVQADTSDVSQTVTSTQISNLATNGRNVLQLTTLVPGASSTMPDFDLPVAQFQNRSVYFNGMRQDANNWLIDGGEAYDRGGGGILIVSPSQEALQEFKVQTSNYAADLGNSSGGMISMAMKSGTRQFHGGAWEYNRNDALDAYSYLSKLQTNPKKPELRYNAFGFNLGGPVEFKSSNPKTFFFYNQEWRREIQGGSILRSRVPTAAEYGGNLSTMLFTQNGSTVHVKVPTTSDPNRLALYTQDGLTPGGFFPNDTIPSNLFDPNAVLFLKSGFISTPNTSDGLGYFSAANTDTFYREEAVRVDHTFTDKLSVMGHFIYDSGHQTVPTPAWTGTTFTTLGSVEDVPSWAGVVHATMSIKPNLLNEVAFNYNGNDITLADDGKWTQPSGWSTAPLFAGVNKLNKMPTINLSGGGVGFNYDPGNWPWTNTWRSYQYKDDLSWVHGTHNFKFGGAWLHTHKNQEIFADVAGNYQFTGYATNFGLGDFLLGDAHDFTQVQLQDFVSISFNNFNLYGMDDWRVTKRLTVNLGLRWEGLPHAYDTNNRASNFYCGSTCFEGGPNLYDPANAPIFIPGQGDAMDTSGPGFSTVSGAKLSNVPFYINGIGLAGRNGIPKGLVQNHWTTFAPRLGFAYDLTGNQKTILRGGGGIFYERNAGNEEYNMGTNVPFTNNSTTSNPDLTNPLADWSTGVAAGTSAYHPHGFTGIPDSYPITTVYQFNVGIQRQLTSNAVFSLGYVGNTANHLSQTQQINTVPANDPNRAAICGGPCNSAGGYNANFDRPYLGWSQINIVYNEGNSNYNGLQASLRATAWKHLTVNGTYTYSHAFDVIDGQLFNNISNPMDPRYDYGTAGYDRRHIATFSFVYDLPIFQNSARATKALLGGWTISGVVLAQTGTPLNVNAGNDNLGFGGGTTNHADLVAPIAYPKTFKQWFSTSSFAQPAALTWGDSPRNAIKGPGRDNWNLSLYKTFQFTERAGLEFRAESFNTWNHTQFTGVDTGLFDGGFGQVNATADPRVFQLGANVFF